MCQLTNRTNCVLFTVLLHCFELVVNSPFPVPASGNNSLNGSHRIYRRHLPQYYELHSSLSEVLPQSADTSFSSNTATANQLTHYLPHFVNEPYGRVVFSNQYGTIIPCSVKFTPLRSSTAPSQFYKFEDTQLGQPADSELIKRIYWEVRDIRTVDNSHFTSVIDVDGLREQRPDGSLAFLPFSEESSLVTTELHNALYRCVVEAEFGIITSRSVHVSIAYESHVPNVVVRSYDASVSESNDALLKCTVNSELYKVAAWLTDDEDIYLPFDQHTTYIPLDTRHYVLPTGELLVVAVRATDVRRQFKCRVRHKLTGEAIDSTNWARIKLSDAASHISYRPRFNLNASLRQTLTIDDGNRYQATGSVAEAVDLYCSFDGNPPPNITWYFIGYQENANRPQQLSPKHGAETRHDEHYLITARHLRINQPSVHDIGTYVCVGNNSHFEVRHETDFMIRNYLQVNVSLDKSTPTLLPGDSVTLSCNLTHLFDGTAGVEETASITEEADNYGHQRTPKLFEQVLNSRFIITYHWYHNLVPILAQDAINYVNKRANNNRSPYSGVGGNNNRRNYNSPPQSYPSSSASLTSSSSTSPTSSLHYELLEKNVLRIPNVAYADTGIYQCFVKLTGPDYEEWLQSATMVQLKQEHPKFVSTFGEQILISNNELSLQCSATGIPAPIIIWQRNGINLTDLAGNLITSHQHHKHHQTMIGGLYRYKTSMFQSKVQQSSTFSPNTGSNPTFHFQTTSHFNITSLRSQDVGLFRCVAINEAGVSGHQARISMIGVPYAQPIADITAVVGQPVVITCAYSGYPIEEVYFVKSKRRLPYDERHSVASLGVITISQVDKSDEDEYSCVVVGENGQRSEQSFRVHVVSPPVLSPFLFSDALEEGTRATAICSVISGDPPITLQWLKDGQPLLTGSTRVDPHIQVLNIKEFISSLIITNITRRHRGVYTCLATTPNTSTNCTARMEVKAPPKWLIKPSNHIAITQPNSVKLIKDSEQVTTGITSSVRFDCLASGNPTPVIRWKYLRFKYHTDKHDPSQYDVIPILSSPQIHVLENGSLLIRNLDKSKYEGVYLCEVSNGVGKVLEAKASLVIHTVPQLAVKILPHNNNEVNGNGGSHHSMPINDNNSVINLSLRRHSQVSLSCTGTGSVPLSINWFKDGHEINAFDIGSVTSTSSFRLFEKKPKQVSFTNRSVEFGERVASLLLKHISRSDSARYVCMGRNSYGSTIRTVNLRVLEPPDSPEQLKAIEVGSRTVTLTWSVPYTGNLPLLSQNIEYKKESDKTWHNALMIKSNTNTVSIHGLQPLTSYEFRVSCVNELGASDHSRSITLTTQMEAPTVLPDNLRAVPLSTHTVRLTWSIRLPVATSTTDSIEVIDGFYIGYRPIGTTTLDFTPYVPASSVSASTKQTSGSETPTSVSYTYKTISNSPMQPPMLYSAGGGGGGVAAAAAGAGGFLIKLHNQSVVVNGENKQLSRTSSPNNNSGKQTQKESTPINTVHHQYYEHVVDTLLRQTQYQFIVQAFNEKGAGPTSIEVTARTFAHDPPRPPNFRIENVSTHEAILAWDYSGYTPTISPLSGYLDSEPLLVDGYVLSYHLATGDKHSETDDWQSVTISSSSASTYLLQNLRCGTEYIARIEAFNEMGTGKPSEPIRFSTLGTVPIPPDKHHRQFIQSNITFVVINLNHWSDGGCPITGYGIKYRSRRMHYHYRHVMPPTTSAFSASSSVANSLGSSATSSSNGWITLSTHLMPEKDTLIIRDLQSGTWHDLIIAAQNDAGKREAEYSFATLTETGATVEPLHAFESRMSRTFLTAGSGGLFGSFLDDPMLFIPTLCTIIVLLVVLATSAFLYIMRIRHVTLQMNGNGEDLYCSHQSGRVSENLSLNSFNTNGGCKKTIANSGPAGAGTLSFAGSKPMYDKGVNGETEPLYEQTTALGSHQKLINYPQQQQLQPSPMQCKMSLLHSKQSNENLLDSLETVQSNMAQHTQLIGSCEAPYSYMHLADNSQIFDHRQANQFKSLGRPTGNCQPHLYQLPEPAKSDQLMTINDNQADQMNRTNTFLTTFGVRRPTDQFQ